nr:SDR family oxidoreductase [Streptomyces caniscabiei]
MGQGRTVLLADIEERTLKRAEQVLTVEGLTVVTHVVDVTSADSVRELASAAREAGEATQVMHPAGLSPAHASGEAILAVDLLGVALVLEAFEPVIAPGGAGVALASTAATWRPP